MSDASAPPQEQDFLSRMSHELRTPLNAIKGYAELLLEDKASDHPDSPDLQGILRSTHRLLAFVDAVLDLNQIQSGRTSLDRTRFSVTELVEEVQLAVTDEATRNDNQLSSKVEELTVHNDRRLLRQILFNLLHNAARFTYQGTVALRIRSLPGHRMEIVVADNGIGMTRRQVEAATEPFWQADSGTTRRYDGAGVGLSVCRGLAELMGGDLQIESRLGEGARVTVRLPLEVEADTDAWDDEDDETMLLR